MRGWHATLISGVWHATAIACKSVLTRRRDPATAKHQIGKHGDLCGADGWMRRVANIDLQTQSAFGALSVRSMLVARAVATFYYSQQKD